MKCTTYNVLLKNMDNFYNVFLKTFSRPQSFPLSHFSLLRALSLYLPPKFQRHYTQAHSCRSFALQRSSVLVTPWIRDPTLAHNTLVLHSCALNPKSVTLSVSSLLALSQIHVLLTLHFTFASLPLSCTKSNLWVSKSSIITCLVLI